MEQIMNSREKRAHLLGNEKIPKLILTLTIPTIIAMLINGVYNITDALFIGQLKNPTLTGAVGIAFPLFMMLNSLGLAIGIGSASYISRSLGANKIKEANKTVSIGFFTSLTLGFIFSVIILIYLKPILYSVGSTNTIIKPATSYARILVIGSVLTVINMTLNNLIRAEGNSKYSMYGIIIGALSNIFLDYIFIFTFHLGIQGAALATVVGQFISTLFLLSYYVFKQSYLTLSIKNFSFDKQIYIQIIKIGIPMFITQFLTSYSITLLNNTVNAYGDSAIAAINNALRINSFVLFILIGYMQGFQPIASYSYGAKKYDRLHQAIKLSLIYTTIFSVIVTILFIIFAKDIMKLFLDDPDVIRIGTNQLIGIGLLRPFLGFLFIYQGIFQALGKSIQAGILALGRQGIFLIFAILTLPPLFKYHPGLVSFFIKILPYKNEHWLIGVAYTQSLADFIALFTTSFLALHLSKELKIKQLQQ